MTEFQNDPRLKGVWVETVIISHDLFGGRHPPEQDGHRLATGEQVTQVSDLATYSDAPGVLRSRKVTRRPNRLEDSFRN
jgi:hypothetical protein